MGRLIDDLQDMARISRGKMLIRFEPVDLVSLVREVVEDQRPGLEEGGLTLELALPQSPLIIHGDATRLAQIVVNLLSNALKFTDPGGAVAVHLSEDGNWATLTVRDTGIGIDPSLQDRIFEQFAQAERSLERSRGGLGLGLALVKGVVELHGGDCRLESAGLGEGTSVICRLPCLAQEPSPSSTKLGTVPADGEVEGEGHGVGADEIDLHPDRGR
jgi:signal transduction histidine kinase